MPKISRGLVIWLVILIVAIVIFFTVISPGGGGESITTAELIDKIRNEGGDVTIKGTSLTAEIDGNTYETTVPESFDAFEVFDKVSR